MPTLMTSHLPTSDPAPVAPVALTLSFGGVEFVLVPSDSTAEVSYRNIGQDGVSLSLANFTGTLQVATKCTMTGVHPTTATVEEEPNSPDITTKTANVTPGQKKLAFQKKTAAARTTKTSISKKSEKNSQDRKRSIESEKVVVAKKTCQRKVDDHTSVASNENKVPNMCQTMEDNQGTPDLSQTMNSSMMSTDNRRSSTDSEVFKFKAGDNGPKPKASVQEILDRVNNSTDSVATVRDDDASSISASGFDKRSSQISENIIDSEEKEGTIDANHAATETHDPLQGYAPPCPRWGHSMTKLEKDRLLIYGGQSFDLEGNPIILSDVHIYDIANRAWSKPINCRGDARQWHSATFLPDRKLMISFGGETLDASKKNKVVTSDSLKVLDTDIMLWYPPAVSGDIPTGRSGHTATLLPGTNELVLFGGVKGAKWLNTVSVLDTARWIWRTPVVQGSAPRPRSYHSCTVVKAKGSGHKLVIFGGNNKTTSFNTVHILEANENEWKWSHPSTKGVAPFPRTGHSATLMDDGKTICIYGGWDPNEEGDVDNEENIFKSSFLLDTETWTWSNGPKAVAGGSGSSHHIDDCGAKRCGHTSALNTETSEVIAFGGRLPGELLAGDFQRLSMEKETELQR